MYYLLIVFMNCQSLNHTVSAFNVNLCVDPELKRSQQTELESLDKALKETEASLSVREAEFAQG